MSDYDGVEDEAFPPLPPPHSPSRGGQDEGDPFADGEGDVSKLAEVPAATRKGVKRPQPKLDAHRLISERGLPALRTLFDGVRFGGKGHEAEDLQLLMQKMENWAHRLYPKLQFDDFIDKVEKLGKKKEVQTCLKRIRLDMPLTHDDYTGGDAEEEAEAEAAAPESHVMADPDPFGGASSPYDPPGPLQSTPAAPPPSLSEEQLHRMELNRRRALEKKLARQQQQQQQTDSQPADSSTSADGPGPVPLGCDVQDEAEDSADSTSTQRPGQPPHKDSEPSAESVRQPGTGSEDGAQTDADCAETPV